MSILAGPRPPRPLRNGRNYGLLDPRDAERSFYLNVDREALPNFSLSTHVRGGKPVVLALGPAADHENHFDVLDRPALGAALA